MQDNGNSTPAGTNIRVFRMTPTQTGMLYYNLLNEETSTYYVQLSFYLEGQVSVPLLLEAWQELINRHEIFRTDFRWREVKYPVQIILEKKEAEFYEYDLADLINGGAIGAISNAIQDGTRDGGKNLTQNPTPAATAANAEEITLALAQLKARERSKRFNFEEGKLSRLVLVRLEAERYFLLWNFHHLLLDGWSLQQVFRDFFTIYHSLLTAAPLPPKPRAQFSDYLAWLREQKASQAEHFWQEYMQDVTEPTLLTLRSQNSSGEVIKNAAELKKVWGREQAARLLNFCQREQITLNVYLQTAWGILLQKLNSTQTSCAGMTVSGRPAEIPYVDEIAGLFINTVPVVIKTGNETGRGLLQKVQQDLTRMKDFEHFSLAEIKKLSPLAPDAPIFDTIIVVGNLPDNRDLEEANLGFTIHSNDMQEMTNYDLTIKVNSGEILEFDFIYNVDRFTQADIEEISRVWQNLLLNLLANAAEPVTTLQLTSPAERESLLREINQTNHPFPEDKLVMELFEAEVEQRPWQTVHFGQEKLTYDQLNRQANRLARRLRTLGVEPDAVLGLMVERSLNMLVGIMGIQKAGGGYLPIDPQYPKERIEYMLNDAGVKILLTEADLSAQVNFTGTVLDLAIQADWPEDESNLPLVNSPKHLAYMIYTSGSTGQPKGVMIDHSALSNFTYGAAEVLAFQAAQTMLSLTTVSFDIFIFESIFALARGLKIVIANELEQISPPHFSQAVIDHQVEIIQTTPSRMQLLVNDEKGLLGIRDLKMILLAGEVIPLDLLERLQQFTEARIFNLYGPTEATVWCTLKDLTHDTQIDIGKPLPNQQLFILDKDRQLAPDGWPGEIFISGAGLARGYCARPELTAELFTANPFNPGERLYRTGDLGVRQADGNYQYLGRRDQQIKVKGYRIELEEIEYCLGKLEQIKKAVVIPTRDAKSLIAYVVTDGELSIHTLRAYLGQYLPEYMIPSYYVKMESLPYLPNGKINRKALPAPENTLTLGVEYLAPRNEGEKQLAVIWQEVLRGNPVGINDDFFDIGGDSIRAIQVVARANQIRLNLSLKDLIQHRTISRLSAEVLKLGSDEARVEAEKVRVYNTDYTPSNVYPYYYNCFYGLILEKMNHERNYQLDKGFLLVSDGWSVLAAGYTLKGNLKQIQYRDLQYKKLLDFSDHLTTYGVAVNVKTFENLEIAVEYFRERLSKHELVVVTGTTYFLNYTRDYYADQTAWLKEMDARYATMAAQAHSFMLVDMTDYGYVVFDSTFNYFGEVSKEDFHKAFQGFKGIEFMAGHPLYENSVPYNILEVSTANLRQYDWRDMGREIIQKICSESLAGKVLEFEMEGFQGIAYFGLSAIKEMSELTRRTEAGEEDFITVVNYLAEVFRAWQYKYIFLRDFLQDFAKLYPVEQDLHSTVQSNVNEYYKLYLDCEKIKLSTHQEQKLAFLAKTRQTLAERLNLERQLYEKLQTI